MDSNHSDIGSDLQVQESPGNKENPQIGLNVSFANKKLTRRTAKQIVTASTHEVSDTT